MKPDAVRRKLVGEILKRVEADGFVLCAARVARLSTAQARRFYAIHKGKPFYAGLVKFMTSGPVVACCLERRDAVKRLRVLAGKTDPKAAAPGTIRADFGTSTRHNVIHASNPDENPDEEVRFYFPNLS